MIKNALILTLLMASMPLWATPPHLSPDRSQDQHRGKEMIEHLGLDASQQDLFYTMVDAKKEVHTLRKDGHVAKRQILAGYASGELTKRQVRQKVKTFQIDAMIVHQNALNVHLDFVLSLDDSQREKLFEKMSSRPDKTSHKRERLKRQDGLHKKVERLSLDEAQMALFESLQVKQEELHALKKESHQILKQSFDSFLIGEISEDEIQVQFLLNHEELTDIQHDTVEAMFALVDGLTDVQVAQLISKPLGGERPQRSGRPTPVRR